MLFYPGVFTNCANSLEIKVHKGS